MLFEHFIAITILSNNIHDYHIVAQGKTTIPSVDDNEEMLITDVSAETVDKPHPMLFIYLYPNHLATKRHYN